MRLLTAVLSRQPATRSLAPIFVVPHGVSLPLGIAWQVDGCEPQRLASQASDSEWLCVGVPVSDDLLNTLRRGASLRLTDVAAANREPVIVLLPRVEITCAALNGAGGTVDVLVEGNVNWFSSFAAAVFGQSLGRLSTDPAAAGGQGGCVSARAGVGPIREQ